MKKRVLIASFALIIVGLFFIIGTDASITGAAVGIQTDALNTESNFVFGFFLIFIASFMLIVNATVTLDDMVKADEKADKHVSNEQVLKMSKDYVRKMDSFGPDKNYKDLTQEQKKAIMNFVKSEKIKRHFKEFYKPDYDSYVNGTARDKERVEEHYQSETGVSVRDIMGMYERGYQEGKESIEIEKEILNKELKGVKKHETDLSFGLLAKHPEDIEGIVNQINAKLGSNYDPNVYKQDIGALKEVYGLFKQETGIKKLRSQIEESNRNQNQT